MRKRINYTLEKRMDNAIITLSSALRESGKNEKPVILHSISVGILLFNLGYEADIVISGILHDILEDTGYGVNKLSDEYGEAITNIVMAVSYNSEIKDKLKQNEDIFIRCELNGSKALIVKCADLIDNMPYISLIEDKNLYKTVIQKYKDFINYSNKIKDEQVFSKYMEVYRNHIF